MAIKYKIYRNNVFLQEVEGLTATITGLTPNTKYTFAVSEWDGADESAKSQSIEITTGTIPVNSITLNATTKSLAKGTTFQLTATILPTNATNKTVTYTSSATTVATVNSSGLITAVGSGTATITAKSSNNKVATCALTVTPIVKVPINLTASNVTATGCTLTWTAG